MKNFKISIKKIIVYLLSKIVHFSFFFFIRRIVLRYLYLTKVGHGVTIHGKVYIYDLRNLFIGNNTTINYGVVLDNRGSLQIGENVNISHFVSIYTMGHNINSSRFETVKKRTVICDNSWIFPHCLIMPGVTIGEGAVILPGSVVTKSAEPNCVYGGNPAKLLGERKMAAEYILNNSIWCAR